MHTQTPSKHKVIRDIAEPIRSVIRLTVAVPVFLTQLGLIVLILAPWKNSRRSSIAGLLSRLSGRTFLLFLRASISVTGPIPPSDSLVIGNHIGWLDGFVYGAILGCRFIAADWIHSIPFIGRVMRILGFETIDRSNLKDLPRLNDVIKTTTDDIRPLLFFPESTTLKGDRVYPFRSALLDSSAHSNIPVFWSALSFRLSSEVPVTFR